MVSSALHLMGETMAALPSSWNIYVAQASDGDNWHHDSPACRDILLKQIVPFVRYYAYIEITPGPPSEPVEAYEEVKEQHPRTSPCAANRRPGHSARCSGICSEGACRQARRD
ncbi:MAG: DUF444 family protein [Candidatus Competibacteraceae bacterium]